VRGTASRIAVATAGALLLVPALGSPALALTPAEEYSNSAFRATNHQRVENDLDKVARSKCLRRTAVAQARRMADQQDIFHQDLVAVLAKCGMSNVGENVASGFKTGKAAVNKGWMQSPDHRLNILSPVFRLMGIGARKSHGTWYVCQLFGKKA
jgi:uncharacterized protein YkwD